MQNHANFPVNESFHTNLEVKQNAEKVFQAIMDFRAWWSMEIEGPTDVLNAEFLYHYKNEHRCRIRLVEKIPYRLLVYQVLENEFNFTTDQREWVDTLLVFEITETDGVTTVRFTHEGLIPAYECYEVCREAWTGYINGSLKSLITSGTGKPNPKEGGLNQELVEKWDLPDK